jgi:hypothetical protein
MRRAIERIGLALTGNDEPTVDCIALTRRSDARQSIPRYSSP